MKNIKSKITVGLLVAGLVGIGYILYSNKVELNNKAADLERKEIKVPVKITTVDSLVLSQSMNLTGEFEGWDEVTLIAETQGTIKGLSVTEGEKINKSKVVAQIDASHIRTQLTNAESNYTKSKKDLERFTNLKKAGGVSQRQLEDAQLAVENAYSTVSAMKQQLGYTNVSSTISGIVNDVYVEEGSFVMPGNKIASIIQVDKLKIIIKVTQKDLAKIKENEKVKITTDVFPEKTFAGVIETISYKADPSRKFKVTISLQNNGKEKLRAGMFGKVDLNNDQNSNEDKSLVIPRDAIVGSLKSPSVYVAKAGKSIKKEIAIGITSGDYIEVISGLVTGDTVITSGQINLDNNSLINIIK